MATGPINRRSALDLLLAAPPVAALVVVLVLGVVARFSVPNVPIPDLDTAGYLSPALSWLNGDGFRQAAGRDWLYPAFLAFVLKATGGFPAIALLQKSLGLAAVVFLAATWRLWISMLQLGPVAQCLALLAGVVPAYFQACNSLQVFFELRLRPEAVLAFFVYAQLFCIVAYCQYRWREPRPFAALLLGVFAIVLAYANCLLKPSWLFAFGATVLPVFLGAFGAFPPRIRWLTPLAGLVAVALLLALPAKIFFIPDRASRTFLPSTLLTIHAKMIMATLSRQAAHLPDGDPQKERLQRILTVFDQEFPIAVGRPGTYERMGYDPDYLYYRSRLMPAILENSGGTDAGLRAFCFRAYFDTVIDQPLPMAGKIWTQFSYFVFPDSNSFYRGRLDLKEACHSGLDILEHIAPTDHQPGLALVQQFQSQLGATESSAPRLRPGFFARFIGDSACSFGFPLEILFLVLLAVCHFSPPLTRFRFAGWIALLIFSAPLANALTIAIVHALDDSRYRQSYSSFVVFALTAFLVFAAIILATLATQISRKFLARAG